MAVPDFQSLMLPLLRIAGDGREHSLAEARETLAKEFKLSAAEQDEPLPSGRQSKFSNRVAWAKSYLQQAGLVVSPRRGHFQLADRGRSVLASPPARIDIKFLEQYPEFVEFRTQAIGRSGDEGIDSVISEDRLGLDVVYLQAKRWDGTVGRPEIQRFVGALHGKRAKKGVFITTGTFSGEAVSYVEHIDPKVVLIDGRRLAELMTDYDVGVNTSATYSVKRVDSDYFDETGVA